MTTKEILDRPRFYILNGHEVVPVKTSREWGDWFSNNEENKIVKQTEIGEVFVSTVFVGLDHALYFNESPDIFETMIFGGEHDQYQRRYATWEQAEKGHIEACELVVQ